MNKENEKNKENNKSNFTEIASKIIIMFIVLCVIGIIYYGFVRRNVYNYVINKTYSELVNHEPTKRQGISNLINTEYKEYSSIEDRKTDVIFKSYISSVTLDENKIIGDDYIFATNKDDLSKYCNTELGTKKVHFELDDEWLDVDKKFSDDFFDVHNLVILINGNEIEENNIRFGYMNYHLYKIDDNSISVEVDKFSSLQDGYKKRDTCIKNSDEVGITFIVLEKDVEKVSFLENIQVEKPTLHQFDEMDNGIAFLYGFMIVFLLTIYALINNKEKNKLIIANSIIIILIMSAFMVIYIYLSEPFITEPFIAEPSVAMKPIIYFYPENDININVKLGYKENITSSYPEYENRGWNILAKPNGDLIDLSNGRSLYSLYYENKNEVDFKVEEDGFIVEGENVAKFLEEKLAILGLSEKEANEFIIYWLPKLEVNKYNYIRFASMDEINKNMPLYLSEKPDTLIRVLMTYKKLNKKIEIKEQNLNNISRNGFTVVEWGGTEIK